jgi:CRP-like cAMP-binding protein
MMVLYLSNLLTFVIDTPGDLFVRPSFRLPCYSILLQIASLCEEQQFWEISMADRVFTAVTKSDCEVLRLNRRDLLDVIEP